MPAGFRLIIDRGFAEGRSGGDRSLVPLSAGDRGRAGAGHGRSVLLRQLAGRARGRRYPAGSAEQSAAPVAGLLRGEQPQGNLQPDDGRHGA